MLAQALCDILRLVFRDSIFECFRWVNSLNVYLILLLDFLRYTCRTWHIRQGGSRWRSLAKTHHFFVNLLLAQVKLVKLNTSESHHCDDNHVEPLLLWVDYDLNVFETSQDYDGQSDSQRDFVIFYSLLAFLNRFGLCLDGKLIITSLLTISLDFFALNGICRLRWVAWCIGMAFDFGGRFNHLYF